MNSGRKNRQKLQIDGNVIQRDFETCSQINNEPIRFSSFIYNFLNV
jgi:hypothetical protein